MTKKKKGASQRVPAAPAPPPVTPPPPAEPAAAPAPDAPPAEERGVSTWAVAWRQFKKDRVARVALVMLGLLAATALLSPLLANNKPVICSYKGTLYFPAFKDYLDENIPIPWNIPRRLQEKFPSLSPAYKGSPLPRRRGESVPDWRRLKAELDTGASDGWYLGSPLPYFYKETSSAIKVRPHGPIAHLTVQPGSKAEGELVEIIPRHEWSEVKDRLRTRDRALALERIIVEWEPADPDDRVERDRGIDADAKTPAATPATPTPAGVEGQAATRRGWIGRVLHGIAKMLRGERGEWRVRAAPPPEGEPAPPAPQLAGKPLDQTPRGLKPGDVITIDGAGLRFTVPPTHPLGTDGDGRDVLARLIHGCVIAGSVGFVSVGIYVTIGIILGALAGYFRGPVDLAISRLIEIVICFPTFFLIITIVAVFEKPSIYNIMIALGLTGWTGVARLVRGEFLKCMAEEYVAAAKALGLSDARIIFRHVLPNAMAPVFVSASFGVAGAILTESSLSFLGFGVSPPTASWGEILQQGRTYINENCYHLVWFPGLAIFFTVTMFNLVGEGLRDALDPKLRR